MTLLRKSVAAAAIALVAPHLVSLSAAQEPIVLKNDGGYRLGAFRSELNPWGAGSLIAGRDYSQLMSIDPSTFPANVRMEWNWNAPGSRIVSYPFIEYRPPETARVASLSELVSDYAVSIEGDLADFSVAFDIWLANAPAGDFLTTTHEIMVVVHATDKPASGSVPYALPQAGLGSATIYVDRNWGDPKWHQWSFVIVKVAPDRLQGRVQLGFLLKDLVWRGIMTGKEYIKSIQLGAEIFKGKGAITFRKLDYAWASKPTSTATSDMLRISDFGGNYVMGASNTVSYVGKFAEFELRRNGALSLIKKQGIPETLDLLENVYFVKFDDGVLDLRSGHFRASQ